MTPSQVFGSLWCEDLYSNDNNNKDKEMKDLRETKAQGDFHSLFEASDDEILIEGNFGCLSMN